MSKEGFLKDNNIYDYNFVGDFFIGFYDVMYGTRVRAGVVGSFCCDIDLCCGAGSVFNKKIKDLYLSVMKENHKEGRNIMNGLPTYTDIKPCHNDVGFMKWLGNTSNDYS